MAAWNTGEEARRVPRISRGHFNFAVYLQSRVIDLVREGLLVFHPKPWLERAVKPNQQPVQQHVQGFIIFYVGLPQSNQPTVFTEWLDYYLALCFILSAVCAEDPLLFLSQ